METPPSDDRAPEPASGRRRLPRGVWFAIALAIVVLAIAAFQATGSTSPSSKDDVAQLDPSLSEPSDTNPMARTGSALIGQPAPDTEIARFDGTFVKLGDYVGTPMVVNFWAVNCAPCRSEMPAFEQVHQAVGDRVAFVGVDTGESVESGRPFAEEMGVTYDLASDPRGDLIRQFRSTVLPTTVLIRADGTVARMRAGAVSATELQDWIEQDLLS